MKIKYNRDLVIEILFFVLFVTTFTLPTIYFGYTYKTLKAEIDSMQVPYIPMQIIEHKTVVDSNGRFIINNDTFYIKRKEAKQ